MAKTPAYRLQVVFEMREKKKVEAEEAYAEKRKLVALEQKKLDGMKQKLREMVQLRQTKKADYADRTRAGEYTIAQIQGNDRHVEKLRLTEEAFQVEIDRQHERVVDAERVAQDAMDVVIKCTQDFKALEKHKDKWLKQIKREQMIKEEMAAEDIAQAQYFQKLLAEIGEA